MKAKLSIGDVEIELKGDADEVARVIAEQKVDISPRAVKDILKKSGAKKKLTALKAKAAPGKKKRKREPIKRWSNKENEKLKAEYKAKTIAELSKILGRSKAAITQRIIILKNAGELKEG